MQIFFLSLFLTKIHVKDTQCGFKAFKRNIAKKIIKKQKIERWPFDVEYLYIAKLNKYSICEIPIIWNTSGYELPETIKKLNGYVDIFLTDFKYYDSSLSGKLSLASDYYEKCAAATLEMRKLQPKDIFENGLMKKGIIIRHLCLPGQTKDSEKIIDWIYENLGNQTYLSLMSQYVPMGKADLVPEINRKIKPLEYKILINKLQKLGFKNVFLQDYSSANTEFTPDFKNQDKKFIY